MITFKTPDVSDAGSMWEIAQQSPLDSNSSYAYLMMAEYFSDRCMVAIDENTKKIVGFVTGFIQYKSPDTLFVWQVAVDKKYRGENIAFDMISKLFESLDVTKIEATITKENKSSMRLFRKIAEKYGKNFKTDKGFEEDDFPDDKNAEMLITIC